MDDTTARQLQSRATPLELINLEEPNETRHFEKVEHVGLVLSGASSASTISTSGSSLGAPHATKGRLDATSANTVIARLWRGAVRSQDGEEYANYMRKTGVAAYAATAGNRGVWMLRRDLGEHTEFVMFTLWDSLEAIKRFAGDDYETAVFYPEDERYLIERDLRACHFDVDAYEPGFDDRPAQLRGEQVVLRPLAAADVERIAAIQAEPEVSR